MFTSPRALLGVVLFAFACQSPTVPVNRPKNADTPAVREGTKTPSPKGEPERGEDDVAPLVEVPPDEVSTPLSGPAVLYGQEARNGRRPSAPGRRGDLLMAIDSPYQIFGRSASYLHVAAWRPDGKPANGAQVYIDRKRVGLTDASGTLVFRYEPPQANKEQPDFGSGSLFVIDGGGRCGAVSFSPYERTKTFAVDRLYVYTDRGVFQPGETVHVRAIGWRLKHDYSPLASAPIEFLLRDVSSSHTIAAAAATTDEFGVTAIDLPLPRTAAPGIYELRVAYGSERASTRLQVRRFEPPTTRVEHDIGRFLLRSAPRALDFRVTLHPPANQKLKWAHIQALAKAPRGKLVAHFAQRVAGNGPHALSFSKDQIAKLIAATPEGEVATIELDVRDHLGRRERLTRELRVTATPYVAVLELDRDEYATGDPVSVVARVSDRDSVPLRNKAVQLKLKDASVAATTDDSGMATFSLRMPSATSKVVLSIPGDAPRIAETTLAHSEPAPMRTELGSPVVKERQTATVAAFFPTAFSPVEGYVHMDITDTSGALVGSKLLPVQKEGGRFVARGDFEAPSWGSMLLTFFALGRSSKGPLGLLVAGQNLVVQTDRELQVELEGLSDVVRPGAPLEVRARVRDRQGNDADVSLGAALVDRSILALKDPLEVTPMDRFYNPELRTLSTTGSKILTWPVVTRNWGQHRHDIALPPFAWHEGGSVGSCREHWDDEDYEAAGETPGGFGTGQGFGSGHGGLGMSGTTRVEITIRTRFPATALWEPHLRGKGSVDIRGRFPDSIGEQELIVVASDKHGGVGLARKAIRVTQPVFVEADLPSPAIAGEELWLPTTVHNLTDRDASFTLELDGKRRRLAVAKGSAGALALPLRVDRVGSREVNVRAVGAGHDDRVTRRIDVAPRGVPVSRVRSTTVSSAKPFRLEFDVPKHAADADAHLRIEFPAVTSAFVDIDDIVATIEDTPWSLASDLTSAALVLDLAKRHGAASEQLDELRSELLAALTMVARIQAPDGSFSYWRNGKASPYITAVLLEGLLEARRIGMPAPKAAIAKAATYLAHKLAKGDLVDLGDIAWWEGNSALVRLGITAEIFDALARLPVEERRGPVGVALDRSSARYLEYLQRGDLDPLVAGRALSALLRLGKMSPSNARRIAARLVRERDEGHVEPSWFHAYGSRVDATLAVLEALQLADPFGFVAEKRDALAWILSTRPSWGAWHNEAGTASALRALALVGAPPSEVSATVSVALDGKVVHTTRVDPKDPWLSTASLAHLDLGRHLRAGRHVVEVSYTGKLRPAVSLTSRFWHKGQRGPASSKGVTLAVDGPKRVASAASAALRVEATGDRIAGSTIVLGHSGLLELDIGALGTMTGRGKQIADVRMTERGLELLVAPDAKAVRIALPFHAVRRGRGRLPTVAWFGRTRGEPLVLDPGPLTVH